MINSEPNPTLAQTGDEEAVHQAVAAGSGGALALAGIATAVVLALWFTFYLFVFVPRAMAP
jgi:hypothetical protein